ncbi:major facilitator superfamily multidrug-resistance, DHA1 sub-family [Mycena leptocephala]|nr:major facilitator superfamily multidrug-resistance, DHA1 sub-family [Mycena leptocephala]
MCICAPTLVLTPLDCDWLGCLVAIDDSKKRTPIPKFQAGIVFAIQFAEPITALVIYPFVIQFVRDTGITGGEEAKTGFYAGILVRGIRFFLTESLSVFPIGRLSDIYGRRPLLLAGPLGLGLSMLGFGLSKTFWSLFFFRCIQGICNGNIGIISDPTNIADIFSMTNLVWAVGSTVGPFMGGMLADPATKWPSTLGKIKLLRQHPYLLPCAVAASIALLTFVVAFIGLKETLPSKAAPRHSPPTESDPLLPAAPPDTPDAPVPLRDLITRPLLIALASHGLLTFCHMSNESLLPLFYSTPISFGGLGLKPQNIGLIMGIAGLCNALVQAIFGGRIIRRYGPRRMVTAGFCALVVQFALYTLVSLLARRAGRVNAAVGAVLAAQLSCTVNGLAQIVGPTLRSIAPTFASSLFALSVEHHIAGGNMVYIVLIAVALGAVRWSLLLPRTLRSESGT